MDEATADDVRRILDSALQGLWRPPTQMPLPPVFRASCGGGVARTFSIANGTADSPNPLVCFFTDRRSAGFDSAAAWERWEHGDSGSRRTHPFFRMMMAARRAPAR